MRAGRAVVVAGLCAAWLAGAVEASAQVEGDAPVVEAVEIRGNRYLERGTLMFYVSTKPGDRFDPMRIKDDFRKLWETGFLDDMTVEAVDGREGKVVIFNVVERRRIQIVDYRGSDVLSQSEITDALEELDVQLRIDSFYDYSKAKRVEEVIEKLLAEKGRPFGDVTHAERSLGGASTQVTFTVDDGPKAYVKEITFSGNEVFDDGDLRGAMKKIKERGFWNLSWIKGSATYTDEKWGGGDEDEGDRSRLQDYYLDRGYVTASIGEPQISYTDGKSGFFKKRPVKWMHVDIPVTEGDQYTIGDVEFEGLTVFREEALRPLFKLHEGEVYQEKRIKKGYEKLQEIYGAQGYIQWTSLTKREPDPERKVVDVTLSMQEDERYYVGRIDFKGNYATRDKVIRREVYLTEGDIFSTEALKQTIQRVNQLGYFKPIEEAPAIRPSDRGENHLDVTLNVEEQNRNTFTFGGGVSGLEGFFINASFATQNFLGKGETFQISAQSGRRTKLYQVAITEPYLFDRPITAGIDLFRRRLTYQTFVEQQVQGYTDERTGLGFVVGLPVSRWTRAFLNYNYEVINVSISDIPEDQIDLRTSSPFLPASSAFYYYPEGKQRVSKLAPSLVHNTVDNPWQPNAGARYTLMTQIAGGPLGGELDFLKPRVELVRYFPHTRKTSLGMRLEAAWLKAYGDSALIDPETGRNALPFYERYYLGGENQIRGYNLRSVGPRDDNGNLLGGNKYLLFNAEYYLNIGGPLRFLFFFDAGQAFLEGDSLNFKDMRTSAGAEFRFLMPVLNVPFRLIYAWNLNRDTFQPRTAFKFAVGTTF